MVITSRDEDQAFEDEVRRIAGLLFPDHHGGAAISHGLERDGIYVTEDTVVLIEATRSSKLEKAQKDGRKLKQLAESMSRRYPFHAIKAFFVTEGDPTAHQRDAIRAIGSPVAAISSRDFRSRIVNVADYLSCRDEYAFGSARDPETNDHQVKDKYVPLDFTNLDALEQQYTVDQLIEEFRQGQTVVLLGDFGTGKSMTLREVYQRFRSDFLTNVSKHFCIHLNLNDHQGQTDPSEALERHARKIGFAPTNHLVRAWRGGYAHLILDGFDEVFIPGWASGARPVREIRRKSVELARRFIEQSSDQCGVLIAGRRHFFDDVSETRSALGLPPSSLTLSATDFTEAQVQSYLTNRNWSTQLPDWLPRRPLLIGYLAGRDMLPTASGLGADSGQGWDRLLEAICVREARTEIGIDAESIRSILERLATWARRTSSGRGPLGFEDLTKVFVELQQYQPDEGALTLLQRLPGLQVDDTQQNTRSFIDDELVDAARAGDLLKWISYPTPENSSLCRGWITTLGEVGLNTLEARYDSWELSISPVQTAISQLAKYTDSDCATADLTRLLFRKDGAPLTPAVVTSATIDSLVLPENADCSQVTFQDCLIDFVDLNGCQAERLPRFYKCLIDRMDGANSLAGMDAFVESAVSTFLDSTSNMSAIRGLNLPRESQISLSILKKVYAQAGSARKENAFYRGIPDHLRGDVSPVLEALVSMGALRKVRRGGDTLYSSIRAESVRVKRLLDAPTLNRSSELLTPTASLAKTRTRSRG